MRILILSGWYPSERSPANGDFVRSQVHMLRKKGYSVDVVHHDLSVSNWSDIARPTTHIASAKCGVTMTRSSWMPPRRGRMMMEMWRERYVALVEEYISKYGVPDLIHAHTYLGGWVALLIRDQHGVPIVLTEHYTGLMTGQISSAHHQIMTDTYSQINRLTAVSQALSDAIFEQFGRRPDVVPNFINTHLFRPRSKPLTQTTTIRLITAGDLIPRKQVDVLMHAMSLTTGISLTIVGDGPEHGRLRRLTRDLGLEKVVTFAGRLTQKELATAYAEHDIYVHPSSVETFGLVLAEAMSCGLPVVTFDNGGARDIVTDETGVIISEQTAAALGQGIEHIICDWLCYDGHRIRQHVLDHFSAKVVTKQLHKIYADLAKQ